MRKIKAIFVLGALAVAVPAAAAVETVKLNVTFADPTKPFTYDFGGGNSITFTTVDPSFFAFNPDGVSTGGTTQVASLGEPFYNPPQPTSFFTNRGGSIGPDTLAQYLSYATPAAVPYSISESIIGFRFDVGNGFQYGYADIAGPLLHGFRFETTPGTDIAIAAIPEPAVWATMIAGFGLVGLSTRRRRTVMAT